MEKSALQKARSVYKPKLPVVMTGAVKAVEGKDTNSVADQEEIKALFPNTYGLPEIQFEKDSAPAKRALRQLMLVSYCREARLPVGIML